jgi:hypothetical protein
MTKDITNKINDRSYNRPQHLDTGQLEYSIKQFFVYGTIAAAVITLGVTYTYLLIQKIKN